MKKNYSSILYALAIVASALIFASAFSNRNKNSNTINVTGLGQKDFVSDLIVWSGSFVKKNMDLKAAYYELDQDREGIRTYLKAKGIQESEMVFSAIQIDKEFESAYDQYGNRTKSQFTGYRLQQLVQIESKDVDKVENISRQVSELINSGVEFDSDRPSYYYTGLADLKLEMIAEATKDAQMRAQRIAENAGGDVGKLKNADMGVFQIVAQNSAEEYSWGGSFNTSSKRKTATITVRLSYESD